MRRKKKKIKYKKNCEFKSAEKGKMNKKTTCQEYDSESDMEKRQMKNS